MKRFIRIAVAITMVAGANPAFAQQKQADADREPLHAGMRLGQEG